MEEACGDLACEWRDGRGVLCEAHVFFEYMPRETSAAIGELFRGFSGLRPADVKSV